MTFPKGVVAAPTEADRARWFRMDWGAYLDAGLVVALVLAVYLLMWARVGRDPPPSPVVVRYEPPQGFSPAALGYVEQRGYDHSLLAATLVSLAVKGALEIDQSGPDWASNRTWTLHATGARPDGLETEEVRVLGALFEGETGSLELEQENRKTIRSAIRTLRDTLAARLEKHYFLNNRGWFGLGLLLSLAGFAALAWRARFSVAPEAWFMGFWLLMWTGGVATLLFRVYRAFKEAMAGSAMAWAETVFLGLFSTPFVGAEIFVGRMVWQRVPQHLAETAVALAVINVLFYHLLERPTLKGRGLLNELEGFKEFLVTANADRMDRMTPPEETPELFERYLPHAVALGVENEFARRFEGKLPTDGQGGTLGWYQAGSMGGATSLSSALGSALPSTLSSSSASPSSGGGGGGSSGGGGGGGGGGGW